MLKILRKRDFIKILTEVKFGILDQYKALMETENIFLGILIGFESVFIIHYLDYGYISFENSSWTRV